MAKFKNFRIDYILVPILVPAVFYTVTIIFADIFSKSHCPQLFTVLIVAFFVMLCLRFGRHEKKA